MRPKVFFLLLLALLALVVINLFDSLILCKCQLVQEDLTQSQIVGPGEGIGRKIILEKHIIRVYVSELSFKICI